MGQRARRFYDPPAAAIIGDTGAPLRPCDGRISGYLPPEGDDAPLWRFDGDDALEEELEEHEALEAVAALADGLTSPSEAALARAAAAAAEEASGGGPPVIMASSAAGKVSAKRLWASRECRDRWVTALSAPRAAAVVGLGAVALRMHCALFGLLKESLGFPSGAGKTNRAELLFAKESFYHTEAFVEKQTRGRGRPLKRKSSA